MAKMRRMGRKPLGKEKYHFTAPPELMARFDALAAGLGTTRSDLLVRMIHERVAPPGPPATAPRRAALAIGADAAQQRRPVDSRPAPARGRGSK